jgi:cardiolipin synthase
MSRARVGRAVLYGHRWPVATGTLLVLTCLVLVAWLAMAAMPVPPALERLPSLAVDQPGFAGTLQAHLDAPILSGNRVDLLLNGDEIFPAKLAAIRSARASIDYAQYFWADGAAPAAVAEALAERCRAGVRVNVLLDGLGTLGMSGEHLATLRRAGCRVETFRPLARWSVRRSNHRNHRRILVVDGRVAISGGSGDSDKWTGNGQQDGHWRDTDIRVEGPAVAWLQAAFAENWREATDEMLAGPEFFPTVRGVPADARVQVVRSAPAGGSYAAYTMMRLAMASARRSILLTNPYFVLDERMREALLPAAGRGVRVVALTPGKIDHALVRSASRRDFGQLLQGGVQVFEYQASLLHAKTLVVDGTWATVGSANLDNRSFALNDELNVVVYDRGVAERLQAVFERDLLRARRVEYAEWAARGWHERLREFLLLPIRDLL